MLRNDAGQQLKRALNLQIHILFAIIISALAAENSIASDILKIQAGERVALHQASSLTLKHPPSSASYTLQDYINNKNLWIETEGDINWATVSYRFQWKKITLKNTASETLELFLVGGEPSMADGEFIIVDNESILHHWQLGTEQQFVERPVSHRLFLMPFTMPPEKTLTLLFKVNKNSTSNLVWIEEQEDFWSYDGFLLLSDGIYFGSIIVISLLILLLYFISKDLSHLYFLFMIGGHAIYHFIRNGYAFQYLWPESPGLTSTWILVSLNFSTIGGILFSAHFLSLKAQGNAWLYKLSIGYLAFNILTIFIILFGMLNIAVTTALINNYLSVAFFLVIWGHSVHRSRKGDIRAKFYSIAWLLFLLPFIVITLFTIVGAYNELPLWFRPRNGEALLAIALYIGLLMEMRKVQGEKQAALIEAKAKTNYVATMSHELRTPLNGVIGMAQLLRQTEQTPTQEQYSDIIISSGNLLLTLINDILDLTKITEGRLILESKPFDLDKSLAECTSTFLPSMLEKNLPLTTSIAATTPLKLIGDEFRLRQVVLNLLSNAIKFTETGKITLIAKATHPHDNHVNICIAVEDTGIGIEADALNRIFNQFSQADTSTTRRFGGSGLGLAISKAIINKMGGEITVKSQPDIGSTFTINLPLEVDTIAEQKRLNQLQPLTGKKLLGLTDYPGIFSSFEQHFDHWGIQFDRAKNDIDAQRLIEKNHYDGVLAFYASQPWPALEQYRQYNLPLMIMHYLSLGQKPWEWSGKIVNLPVPATIQNLSATLLDLFQHTTHTNTGTNPVVTSKLNTAIPILIAEDNRTNQLVAVGMLKNLGYSPEVAQNGAEAVKMAKEKHYPIILMDCEMPVMDGFEASRQVMAIKQTPQPTIVALTAHTLDETKQRCLDAGMVEFLHKPITLMELKRCLSDITLNSVQARNNRQTDLPV